MGTISGTVLYNQSSYAADVTTRTPVQQWVNGVQTTVAYIEVTNKVKNVPITVWNGTKGIVVKSGTDGKYSVTNVPAGNIYIVETFGAQTTYTGTADFNNAVAMAKPAPQDPSVEFMSNLGLVTNGATRIISLSRNTYIEKMESTTALTGKNFLDAPVIIKPFNLGEYYVVSGNSLTKSISEDNLIVSVNGGTFGYDAEGTPAGTSPSASPYKTFTGTYAADVFNTQGDLQYIQLSADAPNGGYYTICNIATYHTFGKVWFDTSNRILGDERGRFLIVNGKYPDTYIFKETVTVEKGADYFFSVWIMNIYRSEISELPLFSIEVTDTQGKPFFTEDLSAKNPLNVTKIPTWVEVGSILTSDIIGNDTTITITIDSNGNEAIGNDYCIDDISLVKVSKAGKEPSLTKGVEKSGDAGEDDLRYTVSLENTMADYIYDLILLDKIPYGTKLLSPKLSIEVETVSFEIDVTADMMKDGINISNLIKEEVINNPESYLGIEYYDSFAKGEIPKGLTVITTYEIIVPDPEVLAGDKMLRNEAMYKYLSPLDSIDVPKIVISNKTETPIPCPEIKSHKEGPDITKCNENYEYIITFTNTGDGAANTEEIKETLPENFVMESLAIKNGTKLLEKGTDYNYTDGENPLVITSINKGLRIAANSILTITINGHYPCDKMNS